MTKKAGISRKGVNMPYIRTTFILLMILSICTAQASTDIPSKVLHVYGPGGPHRAIQECADQFEQKNRTKVKVFKALPFDIEQRLPVDGDIYYGGAEYMLEEFNKINPGVLKMETMEKLAPRQIGIIVRKGNPLNIKETADLNRSGIDLLDVKLENMRHFYGNPNYALQNVSHMEYTGRQGVSAWQNYPEIDAWVTYKTWHTFLSDTSEFIEIPTDDAIRHIPIALTKRTEQHAEAVEFIRFLKSDQAQQIFKKHGWN